MVKDYEDLEELYLQILVQWNRYNGHVRANIGGVYETYKTYEQQGAVYTPVPKKDPAGRHGILCRKKHLLRLRGC